MEKLNITSKLLVKNTFYNVLGRALPLLISFFMIPIVIRNLGIEKYGIMAIGWVFLSYFLRFDIGIGRATTKFVAEYMTTERTRELPSLVWTAHVILLFIGILGAITAILLTPILVKHVFKISNYLLDEARITFYVVSLSIPLLLLEAGLRGVLAGCQKFGLINAIRVCTSIVNSALPLLILLFSKHVYHIVAVMVVFRILTVVIFFYVCLNTLPQLKKLKLPNINVLKQLLSFGSWLTVSSIISPIMVSMDRFFICSLISMSAVAYYVTPFDLVSKTMILTNSFVVVLFPAFSSFASYEKHRIARMSTKAKKYIFGVIFLLACGIIIFANPFLRIWIGEDFAAKSTLIMQLLVLGFIFNSVAQVPYSSIQAIGRTDITAKCHLLELPVYILLVYLLINRFGIVGVALAWIFRSTMDAILLLILEHKHIYLSVVRHKNKLLGRLFVGLLLVAIIGISFCIAKFTSTLVGIAVYLLIIVVVAFLYWVTIFDTEEKRFVLRVLRYNKNQSV